MKSFWHVIPKVRNYSRYRISDKKVDSPTAQLVHTLDLTRDNLNRPESCRTLHELLLLSDGLKLYYKNTKTHGVMITGINKHKSLAKNEHLIYEVNGKFANKGVASYELPKPGKKLIVDFYLTTGHQSHGN